jgi:hypothetical protein
MLSGWPKAANQQPAHCTGPHSSTHACAPIWAADQVLPRLGFATGWTPPSSAAPRAAPLITPPPPWPRARASSISLPFFPLLWQEVADCHALEKPARTHHRLAFDSNCVAKRPSSLCPHRAATRVAPPCQNLPRSHHHHPFMMSPPRAPFFTVWIGASPPFHPPWAAGALWATVSHWTPLAAIERRHYSLPTITSSLLPRLVELQP